MRIFLIATLFLSGFVQAMPDEQALKAYFSVTSNDAKAVQAQLTNSTWEKNEQSEKAIEQVWKAYKDSAVE